MFTHKSISRVFSVLFVAVSLLALTFSAIGVTTVRAATRTVTNTADSGTGSLRQAIASAAPGDTITFNTALSGKTIHLASTLILDRDVIINGSALASKITISGDTDNNGTGNVYVFYVASGVTATLDGVIITKGATSDMGGGIYNLGTLTVMNSTLSGNTAVDSCGGGIYNNGALTLTNSALSGNSAYWAGGIVNDSGGTLIITNSTLSGNSATDNSGGGIYNYGTLNVTNSTLSGNSAVGDGGGIYNFGALTITDSTLSGNSSTGGHGGGIYTDYGTLNVTNSTLSGNSAGIGGGIHIAANNTGILTVVNSTLSGNSANYGGGVTNEGTLIVTNSTLSGNTATDYGGGGFYNFGGALTITNSTLSDNIAAGSYSEGGGITNEGTLTLTNSTLSGNSAIDGGGIYNYDTLNYANTIIANSTSGSDCYNNATIGTNANNLVEDGSCSSGGINFKTGDPNLGPLANNGGSTQTFALLPDSPAIDEGSNTYCLPTDQRGIDRPKDGDGNGSAVCDIGAFEIGNLMILNSVAANDGWTLESSEYSSRANARDNSGHLLVGDDAKNKQYRSLLYFDTSSLPEDAAILNVTLKIMQAGVTGTDPFTTHGTLFAEMKNGIFGKSPLENTDFQAVAYPKRSVGTFASVSEPGWYELVLNPANFKYVNLKGVTQFRIRFTKDDDNDKLADLVSFYSGGDPTNPPQLIIEYIMP
jgi:hypothetical protein